MGSGNLTAWMREDVLPFWAEAGRDAATGWFHERLLIDGKPDRLAPQRIRVQFRQIYVYAHAALLGWHKEGRAIALACFRIVMERAWAPDGQPGFVHRLAPDGAVSNPLRDAYDHAFAVLALSWLDRVSDDPAVGRALEQTLAFVDAHLTAPDGSLLEGWLEGEASPLPRRQNPQMHWFEAMLALKSNRSHAGAAERLSRARLHFDRMFDAKTGTVGEYFDDDWQPMPGAEGDIVEPGHLAEWAWLLRQHERIIGLKPRALPTELIEAALRSADAQSGLLVDEADRKGRVRRDTRRIWLQTELVKAFIAEAEIGVPGAAKQARKAIAAMEKYYLRQPISQGWVDQLDASLAPIPGPVQTSILYHVFVAAVEADRVLSTGRGSN
jgi:mannose/cellobiose epimerase-like protein (N-acyl-D-glucosamine 2-epimerase family)